MRVRSDNGVVIEETILLHDDACKVLKIDLMDNTGAWGNNLEVVEGFGAPLKELEALLISLELHLFVELSGIE